MVVHFKGVRRILTALFLVCLSGTGNITFPVASMAEERPRVLPASQTGPLIIRNDRGGLLRERLLELNRLQRSGQPVRIEGRICYSTCTMFLSLPQTCVSPDTTFGFHGPSSYGRKLEPAVFERASQIISEHYPPALQRWYMDTGRHKLRSLYRISGKDIIALGVKQC